MKKKVLIVDFNGTAPLYSHYLRKGFCDLGHESSIIGKRRGEYFLEPPSRELYVGLHTGIKLLDYFFNWLNLLLSAGKYDLIIVQWLQTLKTSLLEAYFFKALQGINKNTHYLAHNIYPHNTEKPSVINRYDKLYDWANNILVHTQEAKDRFKIAYGENKNIVLIKHGYFYHELGMESASAHPPLLVMTGRISRYKGIEDAIEAVAILNKKGTKARLLVSGKGNPEYIKELNALASNYGIGKQIQIESGFVPTEELVNIYKRAACSILPYKKIEQSGVIFSSLGLNVPVVCYDIGAFSTAVNDFKNGRLVEPGNVQMLAQAIKWIIINENILKNNMGINKKIDYWRISAEKLIENCK